MIDTTTPYRPGLAAIAAVLALSSTPLMAQVALPDAPADPAASAPAPVAPAAPVQAAPVQAPVQTVQSVPVTPKLPDIAVPAESAAASAPAPRAERPAARTAVKVSAPVERVAAAPAPAAAKPVAPKMSSETVSPAQIDPVTPAPVSATKVQPATSGGMDDAMGYAGWVLLGGGLLLVAGGATFAMTRRPKRRDEVYADTDDMVTTSAVTPVPTFAPVAATPFVAEPVAPVAAPVVRQPVAAREVVADLPLDDRRAALEAMVAEAPSEANPFHSRRNRLRRADYLLRTGQVQPEAAVAEETAPARDRWSEMSFGGKRASRFSWKPATR